MVTQTIECASCGDTHPKWIITHSLFKCPSCGNLNIIGKDYQTRLISTKEANLLQPTANQVDKQEYEIVLKKFALSLGMMALYLIGIAIFITQLSNPILPSFILTILFDLAYLAFGVITEDQNSLFGVIPVLQWLVLSGFGWYYFYLLLQTIFTSLFLGFFSAIIALIILILLANKIQAITKADGNTLVNYRADAVRYTVPYKR